MKVYTPLLVLIALSAFAAWIDMINILTYVGYELGEGPFAVGLVAVSMLLPHLLFSKIFSFVARHFSFKQVMVVTLLGRAACSLALVFVSDISFLILILLIRSFLLGFMQPSIAAYASRLPKDLNVSSLISLIVSSAKIVAPAIGGILSVTASEQFAFLVSACISLLALFSLLWLKNNSDSVGEAACYGEKSNKKPGSKLGVVFGVYFIVPILFIEGLSNFFSNVIPYVFSEYRVPKITLSIALSLSAVGNILAGIYLVRTKSQRLFPKREMALSWVLNTALFSLLVYILRYESYVVWAVPIIFFFISAVKTYFDIKLTGYIFEQPRSASVQLATLRQFGLALSGITMTLIGTLFMESLDALTVLLWALSVSLLGWLVWSFIRTVDAKLEENDDRF